MWVAEKSCGGRMERNVCCPGAAVGSVDLLFWALSVATRDKDRSPFPLLIPRSQAHSSNLCSHPGSCCQLHFSPASSQPHLHSSCRSRPVPCHPRAVSGPGSLPLAWSCPDPRASWPVAEQKGLLPVAECFRFYQRPLQGLMSKVLLRLGSCDCCWGLDTGVHLQYTSIPTRQDLGTCLSSQTSLLMQVPLCTLGCVEASVITDGSCTSRAPAAGMGPGRDLHTGTCLGAGNNMFAESWTCVIIVVE